MMHYEDRVVRDSYSLTVDQVAAALTDTVLRAQLASAEDPAQGGALGALLRVDTAFAGVARWLWRLVFAGIPLALGIYLWTATGNRSLGVLAIVASPLVLLLVMGVERILSRLAGAFTSATDPMIVKAAGRGLKAGIEQGRVQVLSGAIDAELSNDQLRARAGERTVTIPSVHAAWQARASSYVVLAARPPGLRPDFAQFIVLPAGGAIAVAITERVDQHADG
ncbi:MAG: hypothetical protein R3F56_04685 [Planctomycetota bacterium]